MVEKIGGLVFAIESPSKGVSKNDFCWKPFRRRGRHCGG